eukprot:gene10740-22437_t
MITVNRKTITLLLVDPQVDFHPGGSFAIPSANDDSERIADFIANNHDYIDEIFISYDTHHRHHIAHGIFWINTENIHPAPFTTITCDDITRGIWRPRNPDLLEHCIEYTRLLEDIGRHNNYETADRFSLIIWPEHCL